MPDKIELMAPCHFGMEAVLKKEIFDLGYDVTKVVDGRVYFEGDIEAICYSNVFLRTAERILINVGEFKAETFEELFQGTKAIEWERYIPEDAKFNVVKAASVKSKLFSPTDIQKIMKKAMVDRLGAFYVRTHFDETGTRVDGKTFWVHNASDHQYTWLTLNRKRGEQGIREGSVLPDFSGIAVHDCWAPYWKFDAIHAVCNAHLLRELEGVTDNHPEQKWSKRFREMLLAMKNDRDKAFAAGETELRYWQLQKYERQYTEILRMACKENPLPEPKAGKKGRPKRGKVRALIDRLEKYRESVCLFIKNFQVPFDNNQAERDIRMVKVKTKVSGCFRSEDGAKDYLRIMSYVGTARKRGFNAFEAIKNAITGSPEFIFT